MVAFGRGGQHRGDSGYATMSEVVTYVEGKFRDHDAGRHHDHDMVHVSLDDRLEREGSALVSSLDRLSSKLESVATQMNRFLGLGIALVFASPFAAITISKLWR